MELKFNESISIALVSALLIVPYGIEMNIQRLI